MADFTQTAIRVGDDILHSDALFGGIEGMLLGAAAGLVIGALVVSTGGLAGVAFVAGVGLLGGGLGGSLGKILGQHHSAGAKGKVLTGSPNVFIGHDKRPAGRADADVAHCQEHSDSEPARDQLAALGKKIAQGSEHVLINGYYAARKGDKGTCDFTLGDGWPTVVIGGPPKTAAGLAITSETAAIDGLITGMTIIGSILLMVPAAVAMVGAGAAAGVSGAMLYGQVGLRLASQFGLGYALSVGGGAGMHALGANVFHMKEGSQELDLMTFGGQVATPFAGARGFKAISDMPFGGGEPGSAAAGDAALGARRFGSTGAEPEITRTMAEQARADAAYDQIRANPDDVAQIARNTGHSPETIQAVKDHLFNSQHDITDSETGQVSRGNFTPDEAIANQWNKAAAGRLGKPVRDPVYPWDPTEGDPAEVANFNRLIAHEYVERGLVSDGLPYQHPDAWIQDANGAWQYRPGPNSFGAHDLSPNFREDPFAHYESLLRRSSEGIPRPNETNSNLDDMLAGIRRSLGGDPEGGPPGGGGSGGPRSGPPRGGPPPDRFVPARPLPPNPPEGRPITPAPDAGPSAKRLKTGAATEATAPLAENAPEAARPAPEPAPKAALNTMEAGSSGKQSRLMGRGRGTRVPPENVQTPPRTGPKGPIAPEHQATFESLRDRTAALRAKMEEAGLPPGKKNLAAMRVVFRDGTVADRFSYSNMKMLNQAVAKGRLSPDVEDMFVRDGPLRVQAIGKGGFNLHTEPRLLNHVLNELSVLDIQEIHLYTELPPCPSSCRPYAIGSWRAGGPVPGSPNAVIPPDMNPLTGDIPLHVYDKGGTEW